MDERILRLMEGAWDTHMHAMPSLTKSRNTILEIAAEARDLRMGGIVYKDLHFCTAPQASIISEIVPGIKIVSGVALNGTLGGLNPWVVEASFKLGGKVVWMFSLDSAYTVGQVMTPGFQLSKQHYRNMLVDLEAGGYSVFKDGTEELRDETKEIISLCKQYNGVLETSHLSPKEAAAIVKEGRDQKLERMVVTHANQVFTPYSMEEQKAMVADGAMISYCFEAYLSKPTWGAKPLSELGALIREIGTENVVLGSDMGPGFWPSGIEGMRMTIAALLSQKFTEEEIARMIKTNPGRVYGS